MFNHYQQLFLFATIMAHTCTTTLAKNPLRFESNGEIIDEIQQGDYGECFDVTIEDTSGDGLCCSHGDGSTLGEEEEEEYEVMKLVASDGGSFDDFGYSCSISKELVLIGATGVDGDHFNDGAAYLFHMDGTEVAKLTPEDDGGENDEFGIVVSMDERVVVGSTYGGYVQVFSRQGTYERTIRCDDCWEFGERVATLGNLIVISGYKKNWKLFIYSTEGGKLLKTLDQGYDMISAVAISEQFIVTTGIKTMIYSNTSPDFPKMAEINQGGFEVAVSGDRIVIGDEFANDSDGAAYLHKIDGTLVKTLDRQDDSSGSKFGSSVAITDDKVIVGTDWDSSQGIHSGSVFIYSAVTGEFIEKVVAPDGKAGSYFGSSVSVCASDSHYAVGALRASGVDDNTGAAYLFQLP